MPSVESYAIPSVDRCEVLRYLGYSGQGLGPELEALLDEQVARCLEVVSPRASLATFDVSAREELPDGTPRVRLSGTALVLDGRSIGEFLRGAVAVGVFAVTVGMGVEAELRRLSLVDRVAQVVFDAAATAAVERAADAAEASLVAEAARRGLFAGGRFSPGYGDLPLATQGVLLPALDAQRRLGITLSSALLMSPTKSVTAIVGMHGEPSRARPGCAGCPCLDFCTLRPQGRTCRG